jgi:hypothetical protein
MAAYQINYDLWKQRDYDPLYERLRSYPNWCRPLKSCWIISTSQSAAQIRDYLSVVMHRDDGLLVARLDGETAWMGIAPSAPERLKEILDQAAA